MKNSIKNTAQERTELDNRIERARLAGARRNYSLAEFKNQLLIIGLNKYEKAILPLETLRDYAAPEPVRGAKIIPFRK